MRSFQPRSSRTSWLLATLCTILAGAVIGGLVIPMEGVPEPAAAAAASIRFPPAAPVSPFSLPPIDRFGAITERPLFAASRRPPPLVNKRVAVDRPAAPLDVILNGIAVSPSGRFAIVSHGKPRAQRQVSVGDEVEGWRVISIDPDQIVLTRAETTETVRLVDKAAGSTPARRRAPSSARGTSPR